MRMDSAFAKTREKAPTCRGREASNQGGGPVSRSFTSPSFLLIPGIARKLRTMIRCAILPPVPVPYREPLFARLAERRRIEPLVIYQAGGQPGWDQRPEWFPAEHTYSARQLRSWQRVRPGR